MEIPPDRWAAFQKAFIGPDWEIQVMAALSISATVFIIWAWLAYQMLRWHDRVHVSGGFYQGRYGTVERRLWGLWYDVRSKGEVIRIGRWNLTKSKLSDRFRARDIA